MSCLQAADEDVEAGGEPLVAVVGPGVCAKGGQGGEPAGGQGANRGSLPKSGATIIQQCAGDGVPKRHHGLYPLYASGKHSVY